MGAKVGELVIDIRADVARLQSDMQQVKASVDAFSSQLTRAAQAIGTAFATFAAGAVAQFVKQQVDAANAVQDLSEKTGLSTQAISELQYAAKLSATDAETLNGGMQKLSLNMTAAAGGSAKAQAAFRALGVDVTAADGTLRSTDDVFRDLADRFAEMPNGAAKTAAAVAVFGKSGAELIPTLNNGSAGLQQLAEEAAKYGAVVGADVAAQSGRFNDILDKGTMVAEGLARSVAEGALPTLNNLGEALLDAGTSAELYARVAAASEAATKGLVEYVALAVQWYGRLYGPIAELLPTMDQLRQAGDLFRSGLAETSVVARAFQLVLAAASSAGIALAGYFRVAGTVIGGVAAAMLDLAQGDFSQAAATIKSVGQDSFAAVSEAASKVKAEVSAALTGGTGSVGAAADAMAARFKAAATTVTSSAAQATRGVRALSMEVAKAEQGKAKTGGGKGDFYQWGPSQEDMARVAALEAKYLAMGQQIGRDLKAWREEQWVAMGRQFGEESRAEQEAAELQQLGNVASTTGSTISSMLVAPLQDGFEGVSTIADIASRALLDLTATIVANAAKLGILLLLNGATGGGLGAGSGLLGLMGFASGGQVPGAGGPRSDTVPAMLSPGEYVVNAAATRAFLPLLEAINGGKAQRFADGGLVGAGAGMGGSYAPTIVVQGGGGTDLRALRRALIEDRSDFFAELRRRSS